MADYLALLQPRFSLTKTNPRMSKQLHITVATIVAKEDKFLMVEELQDGEKVYNQPAGHLEVGESLVNAAVRETLEETNWTVEVTHLLGIYHYIPKGSETQYVRHCFVAEPIGEVHGRARDPDIVNVAWLTYEQIINRTEQLRSPLVMSNIDDYLRGVKYPLTIERALPN
jgi:ADP-ribose pyrophosphatase YjhB (NUDIX family)